MKKNALCVLLFVCAFVWAEATSEIPEFKDMMLVVLAGQSNMSGRGKVMPEDKIPIPNVYALGKEGKWIPSVEPTHFDRPTCGTCLGRTFALRLHEKYPDRLIGLIPCAVGGSPIEAWRPGAEFKHHSGVVYKPYDDALERIRLAQKNGKVVAILWHQGCSNAQGKRDFDDAKEKYKTKMVQVIENFRTDVPEAKNVPFIMGHLRSFRPTMKIENVNQAIDEVAQTVPWTATVSADGLEAKADKVHYNRASLIVFGERYFRAFEKCCQEAVAKEDAKLEHECTSWLVFSDLTKNNTNILHKNRDASYRDVTVLLSPADSPRKWVGLGNAVKGMTDGALCMGVNASGLAAVMNSGEKCTDNCQNPQGMGTPAILKAILTNCDTAAQALDALKGYLAQEKYVHGEKGSIFFFLDRDEAYIAEITAHYCSPQRYDHGYAFRANIWHNPGMASYSVSPLKAFLGSANREYMLFSALNKCIETQGRVTVGDILEISRLNELADSPIARTLCSKYTNSTSTLELDREYPQVVSTAYVLIGHPRHTICVPVPICADRVHPKMQSQEWVEADWRRFEAKGCDASVPGEWLAFEKEALVKYHAAQEKARTLMKEGKRDEAEKLLKDTAYSLWDEAAELIQKEDSLVAPMQP
ncbi:MAG: hypothetical protein IJJ33_20850 [Victivallales bacterium]|nr:hypothetical protein [Victivallales bacterium]